MAQRHRRISRRSFIKGAAAASAALTLPVWVSGCGGDDPAPPPPEPTGARERRTLHFDLSAFSPAETYTLIVSGSRSTRSALKGHTAQTRARFKAQSAFLAIVPDAHLTHYLENVDLPADVLQHIFVRSTTRTLHTPGHAVALSFLHIPTMAAPCLAAQQSPVREFVKLRAYGSLPEATLRGLEVDSLETILAMLSFVTPIDSATALAFHHPEMMNLDPAQGCLVFRHIQTTPDVAALAQVITQQGPGTTSGGWITMVPIAGYQNSSNEQVYQYELSDMTVQGSHNVLRQSLRSTKNDPALEGSNWHPYVGISSVNDNPPTGTGSTAGTSNLVYNLDYPVGSVVHGVGFDSLDISNEEVVNGIQQRMVTINVDNRYLRYLGVYVQYFDADMNQLFPYGTYPVGPHDTDRSGYVSIIPTNTNIIGIPLQPPLDTTQQLQFPFPAAAVHAKLIFGSLGTTGLDEKQKPEITAPLICTSLIDYGLPGVMCLAGVGLASTKTLSAFTSKQTFVFAVLDAFNLVAGDVIDNELANTTLDATQLLEQLASFAGQVLLGAASGIASDFKDAVLALMAFDRLEDNVPVVGWGARLVDIVATAAALVQTTVESLTTPALWHNTLSITMDLLVEVVGDQENAGGELPELATNYLIVVTYGQRLSYQVSGAITMEQRAASAIRATFTAVPQGGNVQIDSWVYTKDEWVAGFGTTGSILNLPSPQQSNLSVEIALTQCTPPETKLTTYDHWAKTIIGPLGYPIWQVVPTPPTPTATRFDLDCTGMDSLCELATITVNENSGHVGYAYRATGQGLPACSGNDSDSNPLSSFYIFQDIFNNASLDAVVPACGFTRKPSIGYPLLDVPGANSFFLQPGIDPRSNRAVMHVRQTTVTAGMSNAMFDLNQTTCWGQFTQAQDRLAVHPSKFIAGVNRRTSKLEILALDPNGQQPDAEAAQTYVKSGYGTRVGLLNEPVSISITLDGTLLILEHGNQRIQAFDVHGLPVYYFPLPGAPVSPVMPLQPKDEEVTYLDLTVDATGYLYVLYYLGEGAKPADYYVDVYTPNGQYLSTTGGMTAARFVIDAFRNIYTLNYEQLGPGMIRPQPTVSIWTPSVAAGAPSCGQPLPSSGATPTPTAVAAQVSPN